MLRRVKNIALLHPIKFGKVNLRANLPKSRPNSPQNRRFWSIISCGMVCPKETFYFSPCSKIYPNNIHDVPSYVLWLCLRILHFSFGTMHFTSCVRYVSWISNRLRMLLRLGSQMFTTCYYGQCLVEFITSFHIILWTRHNSVSGNHDHFA